MNLFFNRVYGFDPKGWPGVMFSRKGDRDKLIRDSADGDRVLYATTKGKHTEKHERGRLLGMVEFHREAVPTEELMDTSDFPKDKTGKKKWTHAVRAIRAWRFKNPPLTRDIIKDRFPRGGATKMSEEEKEIILSLDIKEVEVGSGLNVSRHEEDKPANLSPSRGPAPSSGKRTYERLAREFGYVYWMQFGRRNAWKVGYSHDPKKRINDINKNIPYAVTGEQWEITDAQKTNSSNAHALEQKIIKRLHKFSIGGEMFKCSKKQFEQAWRDIVLAGIDNN